MHSRTSTFFALAASAIAATALFGETQTWNPAEGSAVWDLAAPNWDAGSIWTDWNAARFPAGTAGAVSVEGDVPVTDITFEGDTVLGGPGRLVLLANPEATAASAYTVQTWNVHPGVQAKVSATVATVQTNGATLVKDGAGTMTLSGLVQVPRIHVRNGLLAFVNSSNEVGRIRASASDSPADVLFDGATVVQKRIPEDATVDPKVVIGENEDFANLYIGAGGLEVHGLAGYNSAIGRAMSTAPGVEADGGLRFRDGVLILQAPSTFNGGVVARYGQLRVRYPECLGTGPLTLGPFASFFVIEREVRLANKVVVDAPNTWMGSTDSAAASLVLTRVGFTENSNRSLYFGRQNNAYSRVGLSLTGADSEPVRHVYLRGDLDLTIDGGVLTAAAGGSGPFFKTDGLAPTRPAAARVGAGGFAFDTNGQDLDLGLALELPLDQGRTNDVEAAGAFANPSFESGAAGWTLATENSGTYGSGAVNNNDSDFTKGYPDNQTTNGSSYMVVRQTGSIAGAFTVPEDGAWCVSFEMGCRPESAGYQGQDLEVTVTVDEGTDHAQSYVIPKRAASHGFTRFTSEPLSLTAGSHAVKVSVGTRSGNNWDCLLLDAFALMRREIAHEPAPDVVKLGAGTLGVTNLVTDGRVRIEGGVLALRDHRLDGASVAVSAGATFACGAGVLTNATVSVAAGGTLSLTPGANCVPNGDFEGDNAGSAGFNATTLAGWTFTQLNGNPDTSGCQRNGGTVSKDWYATPSGSQTAFVRHDTRLSGVVSVPEDGVYRLSFLQCARKYNDSFILPLTVAVDGETVLELAPRTAYADYVRETVDVPLAAGEHELSFTVGGPRESGRMLFLDDIRLARVDMVWNIADTRIDLASGATLDLQNAGTLYLPGGVYVDGVKFTGNRRRLEQKGVVVTGEGQIQVGPPDGSVLLFR